ncbi:hypothetical protein FQZ97_1054010 [compost metagenome]
MGGRTGRVGARSVHFFKGDDHRRFVGSSGHQEVANALLQVEFVEALRPVVVIDDLRDRSLGQAEVAGQFSLLAPDLAQYGFQLQHCSSSIAAHGAQWCPGRRG